MTYADNAALAADPAFQGRVRAALHTQAVKVGLGGWDNDAQKAHDMGLLTQIISRPTVYTEAFAWAICAHCGITTASTDTQLDEAITTVWPAMSGYLAASAPAPAVP